jgi:hypothetical protein
VNWCDRLLTYDPYQLADPVLTCQQFDIIGRMAKRKEPTNQQKILRELRQEILEKFGPKARGAPYAVQAEITRRGYLHVVFPPHHTDSLLILMGDTWIHVTLTHTDRFELAHRDCIDQVLDLVDKIHKAQA